MLSKRTIDILEIVFEIMTILFRVIAIGEIAAIAIAAHRNNNGVCEYENCLYSMINVTCLFSLLRIATMFVGRDTEDPDDPSY